jgi:hypothetical protein
LLKCGPMNGLLMNHIVRDGTLSMKAQCCPYDDGPSRRSDHGNVPHCMQHTWERIPGFAKNRDHL